MPPDPSSPDPAGSRPLAYEPPPWDAYFGGPAQEPGPRPPSATPGPVLHGPTAGPPPGAAATARGGDVLTGGGPPRRPGWLIPVLVALVAGALGIALGALFGLGSDRHEQNPDAGAARPSPSGPAPSAAADPSPDGEAGATTPPPAALAGVREVRADEARATLLRHRLDLPGRPSAAWSWTDANGENLLFVTRQKTGDRERPGATVRVMLTAHLDGEPEVLRTMQDPGGGPCELDLLTDWTPSSVTVTDADGDGVAEATVGWYYGCRSDVGTLDVKLALLSGRDKYILRGTGLPQELVPEDDVLAELPPLSFSAAPDRADWPADTYDTTVRRFRELYTGGTAE